MKKNSKRDIKLIIIGIVLGLVLASTGVYAAIMYQSSEVGYDNSNSGLTSQNVQDALDELYDSRSCTNQINFATASWNEIAEASPYQLQDSMEERTTRNIDLGSFGTHTLRIANISTPGECRGNGFSQTACGVVIEFADIITTHRFNPYTNGATNGNGNKGGWPASEMRTYVNGDIYNALPTDLKGAIINTTVVSGYGKNDSSNFTSTDKLYLLSPHEVWRDVDGNSSDGINYYDKSYNNTRQLDYYSYVTTSSYEDAIKKNNGTNETWWLRSAYSNSIDNIYRVNNDGSWATGSSTYTYGVSPAFRIG